MWKPIKKTAIMTEQKRILIIEDDLRIAQNISKGLLEKGYITEIAYDGKIGLRLALANNFDLILLDLNLPELNGYEVCSEVRKRKPGIPIIMLTALGETEDKIEGFEKGADDYLVKPFDFDELIARIYAVIRRSRPEHQLISESLSYLDLRMDLSTHQAYWKMEMVDFSKKEWLLLESFLSTPYKIFSKSELEEKLYQEDDDIQSNTVEVYIHKLRQKLDKHFIKTIRGIGYKLGDDISQ